MSRRPKRPGRGSGGGRAASQAVAPASRGVPPTPTVPFEGVPGPTARDVDAGALLQLFLVTTVAAILATRGYLEATGYPKIGSGSLHIAHMLWGGLLMLVAQIALLAAIGKRAKRLGAVVGGIGFGLFIDELGKFITADNDYFFQPTIALIYIVLVGLFLCFRAIERRSLSPGELLANAADMVREAVLGGVTRAEAARACILLDRSGARGPVADGIRQAISSSWAASEAAPSPIVRAAERAWRVYGQLIAWRWFQRALVMVFLVQAALEVVLTIALAALPTQLERVSRRMLGVLPLDSSLGVVATAASLISLALILYGGVCLRQSRLIAYRWFERSVLVSIFVTQVVIFWEDQLAALGGLVWDLILLSCLRYTIRQEEGRRAVSQLEGAGHAGALAQPGGMAAPGAAGTSPG